MQRDEVQTVCRARAGGWHADALRAEADEQKEKTTKKKKLTWVWMMDTCVHSDVLHADAD